MTLSFNGPINILGVEKVGEGASFWCAECNHTTTSPPSFLNFVFAASGLSPS